MEEHIDLLYRATSGTAEFSDNGDLLSRIPFTEETVKQCPPDTHIYNNPKNSPFISSTAMGRIDSAQSDKDKHGLNKYLDGNPNQLIVVFDKQMLLERHEKDIFDCSYGERDDIAKRMQIYHLEHNIPQRGKGEAFSYFFPAAYGAKDKQVVLPGMQEKDSFFVVTRAELEYIQQRKISDPNFFPGLTYEETLLSLHHFGEPIQYANAILNMAHGLPPIDDSFLHPEDRERFAQPKGSIFNLTGTPATKQQVLCGVVDPSDMNDIQEDLSLIKQALDLGDKETFRLGVQLLAEEIPDEYAVILIDGDSRMLGTLESELRQNGKVPLYDAPQCKINTPTCPKDTYSDLGFVEGTADLPLPQVTDPDAVKKRKNISNYGQPKTNLTGHDANEAQQNDGLDRTANLKAAELLQELKSKDTINDADIVKFASDYVSAVPKYATSAVIDVPKYAIGYTERAMRQNRIKPYLEQTNADGEHVGFVESVTPVNLPRRQDVEEPIMAHSERIL